MDGHERRDDSSVPDSEHLWRRIFPDWIVPDQNTGELRISSAAFSNSRDGSPTSVLLESKVRETGRTASDVLAAFPGYGLVSLTAGHARRCGQGVYPDPTPEEPAHACISGRKTHRVRRCLASSCTWVIRGKDR